MVELHPRHLVMRIKGKPSTRVAIDYDAVLDFGRKLDFRRQQAEKVAQRKRK